MLVARISRKTETKSLSMSDYLSLLFTITRILSLISRPTLFDRPIGNHIVNNSDPKRRGMINI
jgi:hypothetical protein